MNFTAIVGIPLITLAVTFRVAWIVVAANINVERLSDTSTSWIICPLRKAAAKVSSEVLLADTLSSLIVFRMITAWFNCEVVSALASLSIFVLLEWAASFSIEFRAIVIALASNRVRVVRVGAASLVSVTEVADTVISFCELWEVAAVVICVSRRVGAMTILRVVDFPLFQVRLSPDQVNVLFVDFRKEFFVSEKRLIGFVEVLFALGFDFLLCAVLSVFKKLASSHEGLESFLLEKFN